MRNKNSQDYLGGGSGLVFHWAGWLLPTFKLRYIQLSGPSDFIINSLD